MLLIVAEGAERLGIVLDGRGVWSEVKSRASCIIKLYDLSYQHLYLARFVYMYVCLYFEIKKSTEPI